MVTNTLPSPLLYAIKKKQIKINEKNIKEIPV